VKSLIALIVSGAFVAGLSASALAQAPSTTAPKEDKKAEKAAEGVKKPAVHSASGAVKTAAPDSLVVSSKAKSGKDTQWTFAVDSKTKIRKGGKDVTTGDLEAGDPVVVRYHQEAGKNVADAVMVQAPKKAAEPVKKDESKKP
jgi:hypothetical protein